MKLKKREKITDSLIGTGEHMCTCAAIVADIIIERGQEVASLKDVMDAVINGVADSNGKITP